MHFETALSAMLNDRGRRLP